MAYVTGFETVTYNGFTFPPEAHVTITQVPVMDQARRVETYNEYTVTVEALIAEYADPSRRNGDGQFEDFPPDGTNELWTLPKLRTLLSKSGRTLVVKNAGFGDLSVYATNVNTPYTTSERREVAWGPHVGPLTWEPLGPRGCRVVWTCKVHVIECEDDSNSKPYKEPENVSNLLAYNYTVAHAVDEQGYTSRTISGYLEIPLGRIDGDNNLAVDDTADLYWNRLSMPDVPAGFRRTSNQTSLSEDKRRLNFSVTDTEMADMILPPGVVEARVSHSVVTNHRAMAKYHATIRASITMAPGTPKNVALDLFFLFVARRLAAARVGGMQAFIPMNMTAEDPDVYGRQAGNFSFSYVFHLASPGEDPAAASNNPFQNPKVFYLERLKRRSGLWNWQNSDPGGNWPAWRQSVPSLFSPRGRAGLYQTALDDFLVDICEGGAETPGTKRFLVASPGNSPTSLNIPVPRFFYFLYTTTLTIFIKQGNVITRRTLPALDPVTRNPPGGLVESRRVPGQMQIIPGKAGGGTLQNNSSGFTGYLSDGRTASSQDIVANEFVRTQPVIFAVLRFIIIKVGDPPEIPRLTRVGGVGGEDIVPAAPGDMPNGWSATSVSSRKLANLWGITVWGASGHKAYVLKKSPPNFPIAPVDYFINESDRGDQAAFGGFIPLQL